MRTRENKKHQHKKMNDTPKVYYKNLGKEFLGGLGSASNRNSKHHV